MEKILNMNKINQLALSIALLGIGVLLIGFGLKNADQNKRITCLERGMVYVGYEFCGR